MVDFCRHHDIPHDVCGKVIVATEEAELEPHVRCLAAIHVKSTGITGYRLVAQTFARLIEAAGGTM
jgi:L-2-hydroxyglutarate oxidase